MLYDVGYKDFAWEYNDRAAWTHHKSGGGATGEYPVISDEEAMEIWAPWFGTLFNSTNSIVFFWVTEPKAKFCDELMERAGFNIPTTGFVWVKTLKNDPDKFRANQAFYTASNIERCRVAVRGSMPPHRKLTPQVHESKFDWQKDWNPLVEKHPLIYGPDGKIIHSRKPAIFRQRIDDMYPSEFGYRKIELFARERFDNWDAFGNEVKSDIQGPKWCPKRRCHKPAHDMQVKLKIGGVA